MTASMAMAFVGLSGVIPTAAAAEPAKTSPMWGATLETEVEFAYRSVHERSLAASKAVKSGARTMPGSKSAKALQVEDGPGLPSRNTGPAREDPIDSGEAEAGGIEDTVPQSAPGVFGDPPPESLLLSLVGRPKTLGDVLTTQVLPDEGQDAETPASGPAFRGRGQQYCTNIATAAADARFVWQQQQLLETEEQVKARIADLEAKIADYRQWLARRDDFSRKAEASVTGIYAKMRPDAAAQQLMALDEEMAAAVITKLNPRTASAVMAEMDAKQAARLSAIISGAAKGPRGKPPAKPQDRGT